VLRLLHRASVPERLLLASAVGYVAVFAALAELGEPNRGIGGILYLPVICAALATGPLGGATAGLAAVAVYSLGMSLGPDPEWNQVLSVGEAVRLASFVAAGAIVGYFARRTRRMMGHSLHLLDELMALAERDLTTGLSTARGLEAAVNRRIEEKRPFVVLVGTGPETVRPLRRDEELRRVGSLLSKQTQRRDELALVGERHFALLLSCAQAADAETAAAGLERGLDEQSCRMTFGYAMFPADGDDLLSLFHVAAERLCARQLVRGEWEPTAASAGLVVELRRASSS
jgi:GGDEF domain-containing protein